MGNARGKLHSFILLRITTRFYIYLKISRTETRTTTVLVKSPPPVNNFSQYINKVKHVGDAGGYNWGSIDRMRTVLLLACLLVLAAAAPQTSDQGGDEVVLIGPDGSSITANGENRPGSGSGSGALIVGPGGQINSDGSVQRNWVWPRRDAQRSG